MSCPACPACGAQRWRQKFETVEMYDGASFSVVACDECGLGRTDDTLTDDDLAAYYRYDGGADAGGRFVDLLEPMMRSLRRARANTIEKANPSGKRLPDRAEQGCQPGY